MNSKIIESKKALKINHRPENTSENQSLVFIYKRTNIFYKQNEYHSWLHFIRPLTDP